MIAGGNHTLIYRWAADRRLGRGIREITLDTVQGKDLIKLYPFIGLIPLLCRRVTARIPLPPPVAVLPPAPSPRGKVRAFGAKESDKLQFVAKNAPLFGGAAL